jgi:hypothetical protein
VKKSSDGNLTVGVYSTETGKRTDLFEGFHASPSCPSDKSRVQMKCVRSIGGIILTEENRSILRKSCSNATLSTTSLAMSGPGSNRNLGNERL